jgi:hypothetical protein
MRADPELKTRILNAWRLERPGKWVGYDGVQVIADDYGTFATLDRNGEPFLRCARGTTKVFADADKAFEAVEKHLLKEGTKS